MKISLTDEAEKARDYFMNYQLGWLEFQKESLFLKKLIF
jgi:hypothetical protein